MIYIIQSPPQIMKSETKNRRVRTAHTLFPADQSFLWLPGFTGEEHPYCTYNNESPTDSVGSDSSSFNLLPLADEKGTYHTPPFPVSSETHISWHTNVTPPYPYHPVPVVHPLSAQELDELGRNVIELLDEKSEAYPDPRIVLKNNHKSYILAALARMDLLPAWNSNSFHPQHPSAA